jgi:hypothetical protein
MHTEDAALQQLFGNGSRISLHMVVLELSAACVFGSDGQPRSNCYYVCYASGTVEECNERLISRFDSVQ